LQLKMGGKLHLKLNNGERPIAKKYREGKMKRTLKRELKVLEIVKRETFGTSEDPYEHLVLASKTKMSSFVWNSSTSIKWEREGHQVR